MKIKVRIEWELDGLRGEAVDVFGYPEFDGNKEGMMFWYEEGNGSCDCNRSMIIGVNEMLCGNRIKFLTIVPIEEES